MDQQSRYVAGIGRRALAEIREKKQDDISTSPGVEINPLDGALGS